MQKKEMRTYGDEVGVANTQSRVPLGAVAYTAQTHLPLNFKRYFPCTLATFRINNDEKVRTSHATPIG